MEPSTAKLNGSFLKRSLLIRIFVMKIFDGESLLIAEIYAKQRCIHHPPNICGGDFFANITDCFS